MSESSYVTKDVHDEAMRRIDDENHRQNHRLDALEQTVREIGALTTSVEKLAVSIENMAKEQIKQGERLEELEGRDGEMWRKVVGYLATAIVGIVVGFLFHQFGM